MKRSLVLLAVLTGSAVAVAKPPSLKAPVAPKIPHVQTVHGETLSDDYFWLREKGTPPVDAYLRAEAAYTEAAMKPTAKLQETIYQELVGRLKEDDESPPYREGSYLYFKRTEKGKQYPSYLRRAAAGGADELLLDLNQLGAKEKFLSLENDPQPSDDQQRLAYLTDTTGFRQFTLHVRDLRTGQTLPDEVARVTSVAWTPDNQTLFYVVENDAKRSDRLFRHTLGKPGDTLIYEEKDERFSLSVERSLSGAYLLLDSSSLTQSEVRFVAAARPNDPWRVVAPRQKDHEYHVDHRGELFYIRSNQTGRNFAVFTAPVSDPSPAHWKALIAHRPDVMIEQHQLFANYLVVEERQDGLPQLRVTDLRSNATHRVQFPEPIYGASLAENRVFDTPSFRYVYQSFVTPRSYFDYDAATRKATLVKRTEVPGYDPSRYVMERLHARAADGTEIPVSVLHKKEFSKDGKQPLFLIGYGSYGYPFPVTFDQTRFSLVDRGVTVAVAHIRGGGDLGKAWHDDGRMLHKKNTFTDFISSAEYLVAQKYTASDRLAIMGRSAGGLLMGAVVNLRPELFHAVIAGVPFVDVINTMLDESLPLTVGEFEEWGNPKIKAEYDYMKTYSPYDNVAKKSYPSMLVVSSINDSQVMYWEPAKWVARLRALKTDRNPLLFKINLDPSGHGGKSGRYEQLHQIAFEWAWLLGELGIQR